MTTFNKEELLHLADLAGLPLAEHEVSLFSEQIKAILAYVDQLKDVQISTDIPPLRTDNVLREDVAVRKPNAAFLAQAPETDDGYFVVPKILDEK
jgi:aspartyl/glutamyl-tRNA(Asn/Gln) amidotransferase C subunit